MSIRHSAQLTQRAWFLNLCLLFTALSLSFPSTLLDFLSLRGFLKVIIWKRNLERNTTQMNNAVPTSPLLQQMGHPHSYPNLGQISNPYEQQPPGKELNKYASLKAVADKVNEDFYSKRRHLAELAAKGNLPLHPVRVEGEPRAFSPEHGPAKQDGQKPRTNKMPPHPLAYNSTANFKGWDSGEHSLRRQAYSNKGKLGTAESGSSDPLGTRSQHYPPPQPYFITNSKTEVTV